MSLKKYRTCKGVSQQDLANKVGVSWSSIQRYESGERTPDIITAAKIGDVLEIPDDELLKMFSEAQV